jgi:hypothetical protein
MDNLTNHVKFIHVSIRIPVSVKARIDKDAEHQHTTFNSLTSRILEKYTTFDTIAEHVNAIPVNALLFAGILEDAYVEHLERLGKELGPKLIKPTLVFLGLQYDIEGLIRNYFEPMSSCSRWYSFAVIGSGPNRKLMFERPHGPKWSAFLKAYISGIIKAATGIEPRVTADDSLVTVYC